MLWLNQLGKSVTSLSRRFNYRRTFILEVLRVKGSRFTAVASQLHTWSRNEDHDGALTCPLDLKLGKAKLFGHMMML